MIINHYLECIVFNVVQYYYYLITIDNIFTYINDYDCILEKLDLERFMSVCLCINIIL